MELAFKMEVMVPMGEEDFQLEVLEAPILDLAEVLEEQSVEGLQCVEVAEGANLRKQRDVFRPAFSYTLQIEDLDSFLSF